MAKLHKARRKLLLAARTASDAKDFLKAKELYHELLKLEPNDPGVLFNIGTIHMQLGHAENDIMKSKMHFVEALQFLGDCALSPVPDNDTKANALNNAGICALKLNRPDKARLSFGYARLFNPNHRGARVNEIDVMVYDGEYEEADRELAEMLNTDPNSAGAQFTRSMLALLTGDIKRGFRDYGARFYIGNRKSQKLVTDKLEWSGDDLD